jgi:hypothetical protein
MGSNPICMYPAVADPVGAASVTIGQIREAGASVEHDPDPLNWYHGSALGTGKDRVQTQSGKGRG